METLTRSGLPPSPAEDLSRLKLQFLAGLNHHIRTPLSGILGMSDLLLETLLSDEQRDYVGATRQCAVQLHDLLTTVLEYDALVAGSVQLEHSEFRPSDMLDSLTLEFAAKAKAKGLRFECRCAPPLPELVVGDEYRLRQVCSILLSNALKFTLRGVVALEVAHRRGSGPSVEAEIRVIDTGLGIPREQQARVFEPFAQAGVDFDQNRNGIGLGLALARSLVRLMGGDIRLESAPGTGSTFACCLRLATEAPRLVRSVSADTEAGNKPAGRILLVEDDRISRKVISAILAKAGAPSDCVADGHSALEAVATGAYGLVLMDLQMPGIDGFETAERIHQLEQARSIPIVALTANTDDETRLRCLESGMSAFLTKPVPPAELLATVGRLLKRAA
jgi:CheY-like chemotaxis protein/anti-sigma regulatory factor (Ser/Thr protein kinase)